MAPTHALSLVFACTTYNVRAIKRDSDGLDAQANSHHSIWQTEEREVLSKRAADCESQLEMLRMDKMYLTTEVNLLKERSDSFAKDNEALGTQNERLTKAKDELVTLGDSSVDLWGMALYLLVCFLWCSTAIP